MLEDGSDGSRGDRQDPGYSGEAQARAGETPIGLVARVVTEPAPGVHEILPTKEQQAATEKLNDADDASPRSLREVTVRITNEKSQTADVRMVERNGQIQMSVRASDSSLANSLRTDVGELVRGLSQDGVSAELVRTGSPSQSAMGRDSSKDESGGGALHHQRENGDFQQSGSQQRNSERRQRPAWLEEMD